jgi:integrase
MLENGVMPDEIEYALKDILFIKSLKKPSGHARNELTMHQRDTFFDSITDQDSALKLYVSFLVHGCMRISEPLSIRVSDIDTENKVVAIIQKGKVQRTRVYLFDHTYTILQQYLDETGITEGEIFPTLSSQKVRSFINKKLKELGYKSKKMVPHSLRHTGAQAMLLSGYSEYQVQKQLGHSDLKTTRIYTAKQLERSFYENDRRTV